MADSQRAEASISHQLLEQVLPSKGALKKAALYPSPSGGNLRILDKESSGRAAEYWLKIPRRDISPLSSAGSPGRFGCVANGNRVNASREAGGMRAVAEHIASAGRTVSLGAIVQQAATTTDLDYSEMMEAVTQASKFDSDADTPISPVAVEKVEQRVEFTIAGMAAYIRGPFEALESAVTWTSTATGYRISVDVDAEPVGKTRIRR